MRFVQLVGFQNTLSHQRSISLFSKLSNLTSQIFVRSFKGKKWTPRKYYKILSNRPDSLSAADFAEKNARGEYFKTNDKKVTDRYLKQKSVNQEVRILVKIENKLDLYLMAQVFDEAPI